MPRRLLAFRTARHCSKKKNWMIRSTCSSCFSSWRAFSIAAGSRAANSRDQGDQELIAGESRNAGVGRIAIPQRAERQHLPKMLFGTREEIDELVRRRTQVADATARWQGRGMQQDASSAIEGHGDTVPSTLY